MALGNLFALASLVCLTALGALSQTTPVLRSLDKQEALRGDKVTVTGQHLSKAQVAGLYLTKGNEDIELTVEEQTDTTIRFAVGKDLPFGRYGLLVLTAGESPMYIEQPVKLNVVEKLSPKPEAEAAPEAAPPGR
ncbi:MAG: hypothetical protein MUF01_09160 [Bryobacterales bacterium]|jgi:hypothetical protein|nr:hypothetical protein [Bryobacterales bacterium]